MRIAPSPDLFASLRLQGQLTTLRGALDRAGQELTTGLSADIVERTGGNLAPLFGIDAELTRLEQTGRDLGLASARATSAQNALGVVQDASGDLGVRLLNAVTLEDTVSIPIFSTEAGDVLDTVVSALNSQIGAQSLFAGAALDTPPLRGTADLRADVSALVAGAGDAATAIAAIDAYFGPGGGFETGIYQGSTLDAPGAAREDGSRVSYLVRADSEEARATLKSIAMAAVVDQAGFAGNQLEEQAFLKAAATGMIGARDAVTDLRAVVGSAEGEIARAQDRVAAETTALQVARNDIAAVDQFTAAARFADLEGQLQSVFLVTSRMSALTLTNYLR